MKIFFPMLIQHFLQQDAVSICTKDIETLFITISSGTHPVHIGVVYRPPSGNIDEFNEKLLRDFILLPNK